MKWTVMWACMWSLDWYTGTVWHRRTLDVKGKNSMIIQCLSSMPTPKVGWLVHATWFVVTQVGKRGEVIEWWMVVGDSCKFNYCSLYVYVCLSACVWIEGCFIETDRHWQIQTRRHLCTQASRHVGGRDKQILKQRETERNRKRNNATLSNTSENCIQRIVILNYIVTECVTLPAKGGSHCCSNHRTHVNTDNTDIDADGIVPLWSRKLGQRSRDKKTRQTIKKKEIYREVLKTFSHLYCQETKEIK